jgi:hypothetical protein
MAFKQTKSELLNSRCNVRLTAAELDELRESAKMCGLSLSQYMRRRALGVTVVAHADMAVVREVRRLGGLLKVVHSESKGAYSNSTALILLEIGRYIKSLVSGKQGTRR